MLNPLIMRRFSLDGDVETARQLVAKVMSVACVATESGSSRLSLVQLSLGPFAWRPEPGPRTAQLRPGTGFHLLLLQLSFTHTAVTVQSRALEPLSWGQAQAFIFSFYSCLSLIQLSLYRAGPWSLSAGARHRLSSFPFTAVFHSYSCHCTEPGPGASQLGPGTGFHLFLLQLSFTHTAVTVQSRALEPLSWGQAQAFIFSFYSCLSLIQLSLYRAGPWSLSAEARHGLLHLHLHSELDLYEGFDVITAPNAS